jgi:hypothetical protein
MYVCGLFKGVVSGSAYIVSMQSCQENASSAQYTHNERLVSTADHVCLSKNLNVALVYLYFHFPTGKAVPLHAMEALGGRGGITPTHSRLRH